MLRLKAQVERARRDVRKKYRALKLGIDDLDEENYKKYRQIIEPLKSIANKSKEVETKIEKDNSLAEFESPKFFDDWGVTPRFSSHGRPLKSPAPLNLETPTPVETVAPSTSSEQSEFEFNPEIINDELADETFSELFGGYGDLTQRYLRTIIALPNVQDTVYGIRHVPLAHDPRGTFFLGSEEVKFDWDDSISIKGQKFKGTDGLFSLIFLKKPRKELVSAEDLEVYKSICLLTNLHRVNYNSLNRLKSGPWIKYRLYIQKLFNDKKKQRGKGFEIPLDDRKISYRYYDSIKDLVSRLDILHAAKNAGNGSVVAEIASIVGELKQRNIIA